MKDWVPEANRLKCIYHYSHINQVAKVKRYIFDEGKATGVTACDIETGGGFA